MWTNKSCQAVFSTSIVLVPLMMPLAAHADWRRWAETGVGIIRRNAATNRPSYTPPPSQGGEEHYYPPRPLHHPAASPGSEYYNIDRSTMLDPRKNFLRNLPVPEPPQSLPAYTPPTVYVTPSYNTTARRKAYGSSVYDPQPQQPDVRRRQPKSLTYHQMTASQRGHSYTTRRTEKPSTVAIQPKPAIPKPAGQTPEVTNVGGTTFDTTWIPQTLNRLEEKLKEELKGG